MGLAVLGELAELQVWREYPQWQAIVQLQDGAESVAAERVEAMWLEQFAWAAEAQRAREP